MNAIETHNLRKEFRGVVAVRGLDLAVRKGELFALLGSNGAGKSTTVKMLTCLLAPTSGSARVCGCDVVKERERVKRVIGVCPQETAVAQLLTVRENLEFMAELYGSDRRAAKAKADELIEEFALGEVEKRAVRKLSGGFKRRLSVAMALVGNPEVLFLDEPTLGLDVIARRELWKHIRRKKGSSTIVLTTHYLEEAEALADRVGIMSDGMLLTVGTCAEITANTHTVSLEEAFVALCCGGEE